MPDEVPHLTGDEIRFLALEGGGGKGFAYLGAIKVLEEKEIMKKVEGVSGTSAGAITALMLALGMTADDIEAKLAKTNFASFFDPPLDASGRRLVPRPVNYEPQSTTECEKTVLRGWDPDAAFTGAAIGTLVSPVLGTVLGGLGAALRPLLACIGDQSLLAKLTQGYAWLLSGPGNFNRTIVQTANSLGRLMDPNAKDVIDRLLGSLPLYLTFLERDMGLFSGKTARDFLQGLIEEGFSGKLTQAEAKLLPNLTFASLRKLKGKIGGKDLLVCGANLSLGRSVLFSWKHTPNFPIADAVRISMGLPLIYKAYVVPWQEEGYPPCGTYVDGGIYNNLPFREIGALSLEGLTQEARPLGMALSQRSTLGLRLEIAPPERVLSGQAVLIRSFATAALVSGEANILPDTEPFSVLLDTTGLSLLQFNPKPADKSVVTKRSRRAMLKYFGEEPEMDAQETADEEASQALRAESLCTVLPPGENSPLRVINAGRHR
jgi:NTE family protein